ncbi:MAG TPA: efflux RND transporter permease subunit [Caulobacteraceae bacterium]
MLSKIVRRALHHPRLIVAACATFLVYGALLIPTQELDTFPNLSPARASVETEAPGMVAEQVEQLVTRPIENALVGARGVGAVHSQSIQGLSIVTLDFLPGANPDRVRQAISESLVRTAGLLPSGAGAPQLSPLTSGEGEILKIGFTSDKITPMALRQMVQWTVRPRLLSIPGVASVQVFGGETRRIEVRARAGDLSDSDLGYEDVFDAVRRATGVAGAGFIDTPAQRVLIEPHGQALTDDDVAAGQIQVVGSAPVRISDVADVVDGPAPAFGDALVMGKPGVVISIASQYGANTLEATDAVDHALSLLAPALTGQGVVVHAALDRPAGFIRSAVREIVWELVVGVVLVTLLLVMFLRDWRAALVSVIGIPLALVATLLTLKLLGWTLNTMTLGGLAVALGLIVDDAVIDVENIVSRLRDAEARHASRAHAVLMASLEVRAPVIYATLLVVVALSPIVFLGGVQGALLKPLAISVIVASLASLVVAVGVTPPLSLLFLKHIGPSAEPQFLHRFKDRYDRMLARLDRGRAAALGLAILLTVVAVAALLHFKTAFLPSFHGDQLTVEIRAPVSTSMAVMRNYGERITRALLADRDVMHVSEQIGRAETGDEAAGPEQAQFDIALRPHLTSPQQDQVEARVRRAVEAFPGLHPIVRSSLGVSALGRTDSGKVKVRIYGDDLGALDRASARVSTLLVKTPGAGAIFATSLAAAPVVRVDLNFQRLAIYGLSAADVLDTVQTAFAGRTAAQVYEDGRAVDIAVTAEANLRQDPEGVGELLLRSSSGVATPLKNVANVYLTDGRSRIEHDSGLRSQTVLVDPPSNMRDFVRRVQGGLDKAAALPAGTYFEVLAPDQGLDQRHGLAINAALAGCVIVALLLVAFGDARSSAIVLGSTLFALIGGVAAVALTGGVLSLGAVIGFFALFGLSARNATLLISRVDELVSGRKQPWSAQTVRVAARERLSPIVVSAVLVAASLLPFAASAGQPGHEILGPMAFVILGGLVTSTLMGLTLSPMLVFHLWRPKPVSAADQEAPAEA